MSKAKELIHRLYKTNGLIYPGDIKSIWNEKIDWYDLVILCFFFDFCYGYEYGGDTREGPYPAIKDFNEVNRLEIRNETGKIFLLGVDHSLRIKFDYDDVSFYVGEGGRWKFKKLMDNNKILISFLFSSNFFNTHDSEGNRN